MRAMVRTVLRVLLMLTTLVTASFAVGVAPAAAAGHPVASSETPGVPSSSVKSVSGGTATYCVSNYKPNSVVSVVNQANGKTGSIQTDAKGSGCTNVQVDRSCTQTYHETIVASGQDAKGNPASSQAIADVPPDPSVCPTPSPTTSSPGPTPTTTVTGTPTPPCDPTQATLSVYIVAQGAYVRGTACGFLAGETVDVYIHSTPRFIGSTTGHSDGTAGMRAQIPVCIAPGTHTFELIGETSGHVATADFTVSPSSACQGSVAAGGGTVGGSGTAAGGGSVASNQGGGPTGGLAFTGMDILLLVLLALVLLVLGTIAVVSVRRRRTAPAA